MFRIGITDFMTDPAPLQTAALEGLAQIECLQARDESELAGRVEDLDALIVFHEIHLTSATMDRLEACRVITRGGVGFDNVDGVAAGKHGIYLCNVPDYGVDEVADHAMGMALCVVRKISMVDRCLREGIDGWGHHLVEPVPRLANATLGIIGLGRIGTATALRAKAFKLRVVACDPYIPDGRGKALGVDMMEFDELLATSDIISLHTPLTEETHHMIAAQQLTAMKPTAVLVNTSRGAVVDLEALAGALETERIAGAAIDVFEVEPPEAEHPLVKCWRRDTKKHPTNLLLTPHIAFYSVMGFTDICTKAAAEVARVLRGDAPRNAVNLEHFIPRT